MFCRQVFASLSRRTPVIVHLNHPSPITFGATGSTHGAALGLRAFNSKPLTSDLAEVVKNKSVPVTKFPDGQRQVDYLNVPGEETNPVNPPGSDVKKTAVTLDPTVIPRLTPTLKKFTLPEKVAIVTGLVVTLLILVLSPSLTCPKRRTRPGLQHGPGNG